MKQLRYVIFGVYIFIVLWLTLINRQFGERKSMLVPFWELANVIRGVEREFYIKQIFCNFIMLMPLGIIMPILKKVKMKQVLLVSMCFSASIELIQFITGRGLMEFDDVFNNTVGAVVGYFIYKFIRGILNEKI